MNLLEEAVIYATVMHAGKTRKGSSTPYILHPLEVAQIISTMTDDIELITAGVLHDVVEDTDGTLEEIRNRFGQRVAELVDSETENKYHDIPKELTWKRRKQESLLNLIDSKDTGVQILWLADKLSNIRSIAQKYSEDGDAIWDIFNQKDPNLHKWYYQSVAEILEMNLNRSGAYKEFIFHINFIWPGTFNGDKTYFKNYKSISLDGLELIGKGAKSSVYRYDDELIVKVYNDKTMFKDIERENSLARKALIAGIPTAISFGIVKVGTKYGSMFELVDSDTVSNLISREAEKTSYYAQIMAQLAKRIHNTDAHSMDLPDYMQEVMEWVEGGLGYADKETSERVIKMISDIPRSATLIHGDFHTGNVMRHGDEYLLVDMDRLSCCPPIVELSGVYMFYIAFGELNRRWLEDFMGFSLETAREYYESFMHYYFMDRDEEELLIIKKKCALLAYVRLVRRCYKKGMELSEDDRKARDYYLDKITSLLGEVTDLII